MLYKCGSNRIGLEVKILFSFFAKLDVDRLSSLPRFLGNLLVLP